jgi:hypothetical protein
MSALEGDAKGAAAVQHVGNVDVESLLSQLGGEPAVLDVQMRACRLLYDHLDSNREPVTVNDKLKILAVMLQVMKAQPQEVELQILLMTCLARLFDKDARNRDVVIGEFLRGGGADCLLQRMNEHVKTEQLQSAACCIMIVVGSDLLMLPQATTQALATAVLTSLGTHMQESACVLCGMHALFALKSELNQSLAETCIGLVLKSMRTHASYEIQCFGVQMLWKFSEDGNCTSQLWSHGVLGAIIAFMDAHCHDPLDTKDKEFDNRKKPELALYGSSQIILRMYETTTKHVEPRLTVLTHVLEKYMQDRLIVKGVCEAVARACKDLKQNSLVLGKRAIRVILAAAGQHKDDLEPFAWTLSALFAMIQHVTEHAVFLSEEGNIPGLLQMMDAHIESAYIRERLVFLCFGLVKTKDSRVIMTMWRSGCVRSLAKAVDLSSSNTGLGALVVSVGSAVISKMIPVIIDDSKSKPPTGGDLHAATVKVSIADQGAIDSILSIMRMSTSHGVVCVAMLCLLLRDCPENVAKYGQRALQPLSDVLNSNSHPSHAAMDALVLHANICDLLAYIMESATNSGNLRAFQDSFGECGGVTAVANSMILCNEKSPFLTQERVARRMLLGLTPKLQISTLKTLTWAIAGHKGNQDRCSQYPAVMDIVFYMMERYQIVRTQMVTLHACAVLDVMASDHPGNIRAILARGGLGHVKACVDIYKARELVRKDTEKAIRGKKPLFEDSFSAAYVQEGVGMRMVSKIAELEPDHVVAKLTEAMQRLLDVLTRASKEDAAAASEGKTRYEALSKRVMLTDMLSSSDAADCERDPQAYMHGVMHGRLHAGIHTPTAEDNMTAAVNRCATTCANDDSDVCVACGKTAADVECGAGKLLRCSACTIAPKYCSVACQRACWKAHKAECKANRKASK